MHANYDNFCNLLETAAQFHGHTLAHCRATPFPYADVLKAYANGRHGLHTIAECIAVYLATLDGHRRPQWLVNMEGN